MTSPTQRTLKRLKDEGYIAYVTEKWIPQTRRRIDAFNFGDVLAAKPGCIMLVQTTSGSNNLPIRVNKILETCAEAAETWILAGGRIIVEAWVKYKKPVNRKYWRSRIVEIVLTASGLEAVS